MFIRFSGSYYTVYDVSDDKAYLGADEYPMADPSRPCADLRRVNEDPRTRDVPFLSELLSAMVSFDFSSPSLTHFL